MAKRGRHPRGSTVGGTSPPGARPSAPGPSQPGWGPFRGSPSGAGGVGPAPRDEPDLIVDIRHLLRVGGPIDLITTVSSMLSLVDPRSFDRLRHPPPGLGGPDELELETLLQSILDVDVPEATALLTALAALAPDARARAWAADEVARRGDHLPAWVGGLAHAEAHGAVVVSHVRGDADNLLVGVHLPPAHEMTVAVYVDHDEGTVVTDCVVLPARLADVVVRLRSAIDDPGTRLDDLDLADAGARITRAVDNGAAAYPPVETDDWPLLRPLVEWVARLLPPAASDGPDGP
jgi:hypothetical protein